MLSRLELRVGKAIETLEDKSARKLFSSSDALLGRLVRLCRENRRASVVGP